MTSKPGNASPGAKGRPPKMEMIKFGHFFKYATRYEKFLVAIGSVGAVLCGVLLPSISIVMGEITNTFNPTNTAPAILAQMRLLAIYITLIGIGCWIFGYLYFAFWQHMAESVAFNLRSRYLHRILEQEIAFFEKQNIEQLPSQISENFATI
jgi:ATP-binding cassette subfamily B (MDR/TAP) protein 1